MQFPPYPLKPTINIYTDSIITQGTNQFIYLRKDHEASPIANTFYWGGQVTIAHHEPGRFGPYVIKSASGDYHFFNLNGDTILVKSKAALNNSWTLAPLRNGRSLEAIVANIQLELVLGVIDSVKTIEVRAKNSLGQILPFDLYTGLNFKLSKQHGLISTPAFRLMNSNTPLGVQPNGSALYELKSRKSNNQWLGAQDIKLNDLFNVHIGDEYHFKKQSGYSLNIAHAQMVFSYSVEKLISKLYYSSGDSLQLIFDRKSVDSTIVNSLGVSNLISVIHIHDTISRTIPLSKFRYLDHLDTSQLDTMGIYFLSFDTLYNNRLQVSVPMEPRSPLPFALFCQPSIYTNSGTRLYVMAKDLGIVQEFINEPLSNITCSHSLKELKYFSRSGESWGTPFDTLAILGIEGSEFSTEKIEVFPNPVNAGEWISLTSTHSGTIRFYNSIGTFMGSYDHNKFILAPETYLKGIYFWQFEGKNGQIKRGKLLVE
jgi:hypothetical protein